MFGGMLNLKQIYLSRVLHAHWQSPSKQWHIPALSMNWLLDRNSMTKKLQQHCQTLSVDVLGVYDIANTALSLSELECLPNEPCRVREVILSGDNVDWLYARTLFPQSTLSGSEKDLLALGNNPLGKYVFAQPNHSRDQVQIAQIEVAGDMLLARRSRLWLNDKPMLVSELFLPHAPIYLQSETA